MKQAGLFGLSDHLKRLSANGDPLEELGRIVDFEGFRPILGNALDYSDGTKGGRPPYDPVAMFKILILAAQNNVTDARMEYLIRDRLSWMRFLGFDLGAPTPDANTQEEKDAIKAGKAADEIWPDKPAKAAQKDIGARWTVKFAKARIAANGKPYMDIAIPSFGYKTTSPFVGGFGFIRKSATTHGARHDGSQLSEVVTTNNTASDVWADTAYRSKKNEVWLEAQGRISRIHRKKPKGKPMPERMRKANSVKSKVRACVEHVFAQQKAHMALFIRIIGLKRAEAKITLANLAYNMNRLIFHERRKATG